MATAKAAPAKKKKARKPRKKKTLVCFRCRLGSSRGSLTLRYIPTRGS